MTKQIGIVATSENDIIGVSEKYMQFAKQFGDVHIILPTDPILDLNLLILKGGLDISPELYGGKPEYILSDSDPYQDFFFKNKLASYVNNKTPIFGICRGLQEINCYFDGTLKQHLHNHPKNKKEDRKELIHSVFDLHHPEVYFKVNSLHHQAIGILGSDLDVLLYSEDNYIEAIRHKELPIVAVQWHPEEIYDSFSIRKINDLLKC